MGSRERACGVRYGAAVAHICLIVKKFFDQGTLTGPKPTKRRV